MYEVIREFKDKFRRIRYFPGDRYENTDMKRISFLQERGYLGGEQITPSKPLEVKKVKANVRQRKKITEDKPS